MTRALRTGESELIQEILRGELSAIRSLDGWIDVVLKQGYPSLRQDWEDLRQEVRVRVFRNLARGTFDGRSALRTYVHRIARNVCVDSLRRARMERLTSASDATLESLEAADAPATAYMTKEILIRVLAELTQEERRLLHMVHVEQRSYADLAQSLGLSEGAVKLRVFRTRRRLLEKRRELTGWGGRES